MELVVLTHLLSCLCFPLFLSHFFDDDGCELQFGGTTEDDDKKWKNLVVLGRGGSGRKGSTAGVVLL